MASRKSRAGGELGSIIFTLRTKLRRDVRCGLGGDGEGRWRG